MIRFACPHCNKVLAVDDHRGGSEGTCPACSGRFEVPNQPAPKVAPSHSVSALRFACPHCNKVLAVDGGRAGTEGNCPWCFGRFEIPNKPTAASRTASSPTSPHSNLPPAEPAQEWVVTEVPSTQRQRSSFPDNSESSPRRRRRRRAHYYSSKSANSAVNGFGIVLISVGLLTIIAVLLPIFSPSLGLLSGVVGGAIGVAANIWFLVIAFQDEVSHGLLCMFVPFYALYYLFANWDETWRPFVLHLMGLVMIVAAIIGMAFGADNAAKGQPSRGAPIIVDDD